MSSFIELVDVTKVYGKGLAAVRAVDGISFTAERGEWIAIMGPSGSGKTTLLNLIGCLDQATSGAVRIDGTDTSQLRHARTGALPQRNRRLHFPAVSSGAASDRDRERDAGAVLPQHDGRGRGHAGAEAGRHGGSRDASAFAAFRRRTAARRHRARAGERSEDHPRRRAHRQSRRGKSAHRVQASERSPRAGPHHRDGDAR